MQSLFTAPQVVSASLFKLYSSLSSTDLRNAVLVVESHSPQPLKMEYIFVAIQPSLQFTYQLRIHSHRSVFGNITANVLYSCFKFQLCPSEMETSTIKGIFIVVYVLVTIANSV